MGRTCLLIVLALAAIAAFPGRGQAQNAIIQPRMLIYAGPLHREYLGCVNCDQYDVNSVWNSQSPFGWDNGYPDYSRFQQYRAPHGRYSACDPFAADPPILVDIAGKNYGRLNVSTTRADSICGPLGAKSICTTLTAMCERVAWPDVP
jgi:hypothetical protein